MLTNYVGDVYFTCDDHQHSVKRTTIHTITNIFFNNKQVATTDSSRKHQVVGFKR